MAASAIRENYTSLTDVTREEPEVPKPAALLAVFDRPHGGNVRKQSEGA
jgi:hypothetical protein